MAKEKKVAPAGPKTNEVVLDPDKKLNTTETVKNAPVTAAQLDSEMKTAAKVLGDERKVSVEIPAYLKPRLGSTVPVGINGAVIHVPVGEKVEIPESMANVLKESLNQLSL